MSAITWKNCPNDPFEVLSLYEMDLVMKNLPPKKILNLSTVSRQWFERTARMESLLERINKVVKCAGVEQLYTHNKCDRNGGGLNPDSIRPLTETKRVYHSLKLYRYCDAERSFTQIMEASDSLDFTSMEFSECNFRYSNVISECLVNATDTLETLIIDRVRVQKKGYGFDVAEMPQLKVLKITKSSELVLLSIFDYVRTLKELYVDTTTLNHEARSDLVDILFVNPSLERLSLDGRLSEYMLERFEKFTWRKFTFKLKAIQIGFKSQEGYEKLSKVLATFLVSQRESLKSIVLTFGVDSELIEDIFDFPALTHLTLNGDILTDRVLQLQVNHSLQHLSILKVGQLKHMKMLVSFAPHLRSLEIMQMGNSIVYLVNENLQHLSCRNIALSPGLIRHQNIFPELRSLSAASYKKKLAGELHDSRNVRNTITNFQQLYAALLFKETLLTPTPGKKRSRKSKGSLDPKKTSELGSQSVNQS